MTQDSVLIYMPDYGYVNMFDGEGINMIETDYDEGFLDYIYFDVYKTLEDYNTDPCLSIDGGMIMLTDYYQNMFNSPKEVVDYVIDTGFIPECDYEIIKKEDR